MTETRGAREKDKKDSGRREENHEDPKKGLRMGNPGSNGSL